MSNEKFSLIDKLAKQHSLSRAEWTTLLGGDEASLFERTRKLQPEEEEVLQYAASKARKVATSVYGSDVYIRGIVEFSNTCNKNCYYCGLRAGNTKLERYRLSIDDIMDCYNRNDM